MAKANSPSEDVRALQPALYVAAKRNSRWRFPALLDRIARPDGLRDAWEQVRRNQGAAGIDGETLSAVEAYGVERMLEELRELLLTGRYRPQPSPRRERPHPGAHPLAFLAILLEGGPTPKSASRTDPEGFTAQEAGTRLHGTTQRQPLQHFLEVEQAHLLPAAASRYDTPVYANPKVARDHHVEVAKALYSVPGGRIGQHVQARADSRLVKISRRGRLLREHSRQPPGGRSTFAEDLPEYKRAYAMRDIEYLKRQAAGHGEQIGIYAARLLDDPLPWTRMRKVYRLLSLVKRFSAERVEQACRRTLEFEVVDVVRVQRMLERALEHERKEVRGQLPLAPILRPRFARDPSEFAVKTGVPQLELARVPRARSGRRA